MAMQTKIYTTIGDDSKNITHLEIPSEGVAVADGVKYDFTALNAQSEVKSFFPLSFWFFQDEYQMVYFKRASADAPEIDTEISTYPYYLVWPEGEPQSPQTITETIIVEA